MAGAELESSDSELREAQALMDLKEIPGLGDRGIWELIRAHGSGVAALRAAGGQGEFWRRQGRAGSPAGSHTQKPADIREWVAKGMKVLGITSPSYPRRLLELTDPPPLLFLQGDESLLAEPGVAVVGARKATELGRRLARDLGQVLAGAGISVISGLAKGIDGEAHQGALDGGGPTVAVLGAGLKVVYPPSHRRLFREIGGKGLLVSEFLPLESARPHHFPRRNRIIASLAQAIVVVEAGERSGAFITVDHGLDLGRDILAFPGAVENSQARGTNRLIRDGARLLTHPEAILDEIPDLVRKVAPGGVGDGSGARDLPAHLRDLWSALAEEPRPLETLARDAGLSTQEATGALTALELLGRATRCPGMRFRRG